MKNILTASLLSLAIVSSASADWASSTGSTPSVPKICIANTTPYAVDVSVNGQRVYVSPYFTTRIPSYQSGAMLVQMNTRQLSGPYSNPIWAQTYVYPAYYGCAPSNSVSVYIYGNVLGFN